MRFIAVLALLAIIFGCTINTEKEQATQQIQEEQIMGSTMKLISNAFNEENRIIPMKYTCQGDNINPELSWGDVPEKTKSFALIVDDPDAPSGTWVHWLVKDMPADKREIKENSIPGKQVINSFGKSNYGGPCPPSGTHRYFFKLYALDVETLKAENRDDFYKEAEKHKIAKAALQGDYSKE